MVHSLVIRDPPTCLHLQNVQNASTYSPVYNMVSMRRTRGIPDVHCPDYWCCCLPWLKTFEDSGLQARIVSAEGAAWKAFLRLTQRVWWSEDGPHQRSIPLRLVEPGAACTETDRAWAVVTPPVAWYQCDCYSCPNSGGYGTPISHSDLVAHPRRNTIENVHNFDKDFVGGR
ncbi:hypothetical protein ACOMHN_007046 [Nucella lapillus]